jgi:glycosyltransferase involved in cell wall biosynthesis
MDNTQPHLRTTGRRMPSISTIIPCFNSGKYLRETLKSVLAQTYPPLEMIVVDDGSTDDSAAIAESFGPPVRVIRQRNAGTAAARNAGLALAQGEYIHFLDADDLVAPDAYAHFADAISSRSYDVVFGSWAAFRNSTFHSAKSKMREFRSLLPDVIAGCPGPPAAALVRTSLVRETGGFCIDIRYAEDWDFWVQFGFSRPTVGVVEHIVAYYRVHDCQKTTTTAAREIAQDHLRGMTRMIRKLLDIPHADRTWAEAALWWSWIWIDRAVRLGVPRSELDDLFHALDALALKFRESFSGSVLARSIRWLGAKNTARLRALLGRRRQDNWAGWNTPNALASGEAQIQTKAEV